MLADLDMNSSALKNVGALGVTGAATVGGALSVVGKATAQTLALANGPAVGAPQANRLSLYSDSSNKERVGINSAGTVNVGGSRPGAGEFSDYPGSGNMRVVASAPGATALSTYDTQGYVAAQFVRDVSGTAQQNGSIAVGESSVSYLTSSDKTLKDDDGLLAPEAALAVLRLWEIHNFRWKGSGERDIGAFAQDLYLVYPAAVAQGGWLNPATGELSGTPIDGVVYRPWGVDYSKLVAVIIPVVQGHEARIAALEAAA